MLAHLAGNVGQNFVAIIQLDTEHRIWQWLDDAAFYLDGAFLLCHILHVSPAAVRTPVLGEFATEGNPTDDQE